jgi:hypothetical protein
MKRGTQSYSYYEVIDACLEPDCPICRLGQASANRHLTSLIYDSVNDIDLRATLRESLGYCKDHAWLLPDAGDSAPLGIAVIHRDLLNTIHKQLEESRFGKSRRNSLKSIVSGAMGLDGGTPITGATAQYLAVKAQCPACERRDEAEKLALKSVTNALEKQDADMMSALQNSDGLCLAHLRWALETARNREGFDLLVSITQEQLSSLIRDLDEFIRKSDHRFRDEKISETERGSWRRALQRVVGLKITL